MPEPTRAGEVTHGYAPVNGLELYYEVHGPDTGGRPLVLLHGNLSTIGIDFGGTIPSLARNRRVIGVEQQAHGHTADIDRPLSIQQWAADTAALLDHLGIGQADLFGYSSGSGVAMTLAVEHPELVGRLVLASVAYRLDGMHPEVMANVGQLKPEHLVACRGPGWPSSPAPPTSPWSSGPTGWPRWSASSSTPRSAEDLGGGVAPVLSLLTGTMPPGNGRQYDQSQK